MFQLSATGLQNPFIFVFALAAIFIPLERFWPKNKQPIIHRDFWKDFGFLLIHLFITLNVFIFFQREYFQLFLGRFAVFNLELSQQPIWLQQVEFMIGVDFFTYWEHRLAHKRPLWRFHSVHHTVQVMDWLSNIRLHPIDVILKKTLASAPLLLLGFSPIVIAGYIPIFGLFSTLTHANLKWTFGPLKYVFASPSFHHWHHDRTIGYNKNFGGILSVWDVLFGTFYLPREQQVERYGISEPVPNTLIGQLFYPFRF